MKISIHPLVKGKLLRGDSRLNELGDGWINVNEEWNDVFELITVDGYATSAELRDGKKNENHFVSRELVMVDIDSGMTIDELLEDEFYNAYGAGFYVTPSYTDELPKFRIMFRLETPITNTNEYRQLTAGLLTIYQCADPACKDASRLFYGTINCQIKEFRNNMLTDDVVKEIMKEAPLQKPEVIVRTYQPITDVNKRVDSLLSIIKKGMPELQYNDWLRILFAVATELGTSEAVHIMSVYYPEKKKGEYLSKLASHQSNKVNIGTLYYYASKCNKDECDLLKFEHSTGRDKIKIAYKIAKSIINGEK